MECIFMLYQPAEGYRDRYEVARVWDTMGKLTQKAVKDKSGGWEASNRGLGDFKDTNTAEARPEQ